MSPVVILTVAQEAPRGTGSDPEWPALRALVDSIPDLEAFDLARLPATRDRLRLAVERLPRYAPAHVALASAATLTFEATRASAPDRELLAEAVTHARTACELDPGLAEAWATLAFALTVGGLDADEARAAARRAVMIDGGSWRHHFRLAYASWGDERLRAVARTLALVPGMPFACFAGAMVHVARGARRAALDLLDQAAAPALAKGDAEPPARLPAAGLDWLRGAVLGSATDEASRESAFERAERGIASYAPGRLYAAEFAVNAWHWRAGWLYRDGNVDAAVGALEAALRLDATHARSTVALAGVTAGRNRDEAGVRWERAAGPARRPARERTKCGGRRLRGASCRLPRRTRGRHRHPRRPARTGASRPRGVDDSHRPVADAPPRHPRVRATAVAPGSTGGLIPDRVRPHVSRSFTVRSGLLVRARRRVPMEVAMKRHALAALLALGSLLLPVAARADERPGVGRLAGTRTEVYVTNLDGVERKGRVLAATDEGLRLVFGGRETLLPWAEIARVDRRGDPVWDGALKGAVIGGALYGLMVLTSDVREYDGAGDFVLGGAVGWGVVGAIADAFHIARSSVFVGPAATAGTHAGNGAARSPGVVIGARLGF